MLNQTVAAGARQVPTPHRQDSPEPMTTLIRTPDGPYHPRDSVENAEWYLDVGADPFALEEDLDADWYVDWEGHPIAREGELDVETWWTDPEGNPIARKDDLDLETVYVRDDGEVLGRVSDCVEVPAHRGDNCHVSVRRGRLTQTVPATSVPAGWRVIGVICPDCGSTVAWGDGAANVAECGCGGLIFVASTIAGPQPTGKLDRD